MGPSFYSAARAAIGVLCLTDLVSGQGRPRQATSPGYRGRDPCPIRCSIAGPDAANWSVYHNFEQVQSCPETIFYEFSLYDQVDDPNELHRIYACTSFGPDWSNLPNSTTQGAIHSTPANTTYEIGGWSPGVNPAVANIRSLSKQIRQYLASGYGANNKSEVLFAQSGSATVGLYIGKSVQNEQTSSFALQILENILPSLNSSTVAMQLCKSGYDSDHIFGFVATGNATFDPVQNSLQSWSDARCLSFDHSTQITGPAFFTTPLLLSNYSITNITSSGSNFTSRHLTKRFSISARSDCRTIQVQAGDGCGDLAQKCGISPADFTTYNSDPKTCSTLQPLQHVCCSSGTLPDFAPKPNSDGSCASYKVSAGDSCSAISAANSLTVDQLETFNSNTWGWNGCSNVWTGTIICLSTGSPPMPAPVSNAVCGPQVLGTKQPTDGTPLTDLNPCPLNACCDVWGQCGNTAEFCTDTNTGAPGTAKKGTNGCISNCGTQIVRGSAPPVYRRVGYFEGFSLNRPCLQQDASQIDSSQYTHLHFAFATITSDFQVSTGDVLNTFEFESFKRIEGPAKILSFGGWDFSTNPNTYNIFRQGVLPANRLKLATNIANFIHNNGLDGVDVDWEYPGAPDIPGIPAADKNEGQNYLAFLVILKNLLRGKSLSIAAPASYWYLRGYPIQQMSKIVDYIIFMTYDLHGQWDAGNQWSQVGCPSGSCLRSQVNLTETISALVMITKAGVPSNQVIVGVTSYGRSFEMADAGCHTPDCFFTGTAGQSNAEKGRCTGTAGYISNAEIQEILNNPGRVNQNFIDGTSNSNILVYDNTQWVSWMSPQVRQFRSNLYKSLNMGGTTDWAVDLDTFNSPPAQEDSWINFVSKVRSGKMNADDGPRTGNWTQIQCDDISVTDINDLTPTQRWNMMDCPDAWNDVINYWEDHDKGGFKTFIESISDSIHGPEKVDCLSIYPSSGCDQPLQCGNFIGKGSGAAGYEIWNSITHIHGYFSDYVTALYQVANQFSLAASDFENKFAPVKPAEDDRWLLALIDLITLGASIVAGPFFNSVLGELAYFSEREASLANIKDTTMTLIGQSTTLTKDLLDNNSPTNWTLTKSAEFSDFMGQVVGAWAGLAELSLMNLFNGSDDGISRATSLVAGGKLIEGYSPYPPVSAGEQSGAAMKAAIEKGFYGFTIPTLWSISGNFPFIIDSGYKCGTVDPMGDWLDIDTMHATAGCYNGNLYYLASPAGPSVTCHAPCKGCIPTSSGQGGNGVPDCINNLFSAPPGIEYLDGMVFGGVTVGDIITGSVRTYIQNGGQNGGAVADPSNSDTNSDLIDQDITTPGFIRLPVCSVNTAFLSWDKEGGPDTSDPNYPCSIPLVRSDCGDSTFTDATTDTSPLVDDCKVIIKNIQGTRGEWTGTIDKQRTLVSFGSCNFAVNGEGFHGNVDFKVGAQDIIDLINDSITKFAQNGRVGANGQLGCKGDVKNENTYWTIF